jgi:O-succinylbenzoic acid--CoA ligase
MSAVKASLWTMIVEGWLPRAAASRPEGLALATPQGALSYTGLLADASSAAAELARRGVRPGQRVAIALPPGLAFARALHACLLLGAVAVPVDLRLTAAEREHLTAGAALLVEEPFAPGADRGGADRYATVRHDLESTAVVIHTSGTTSTPKPIELTYGNFLWSALGSAVALGLDPRERWLCALPLAHVGGLSILLRSTIYATTAVLHERFDTDAVLRALREQEITLVSVVATTLTRLLDAGLEHPPALRCALTGGGPVPAALVSRAREAGVPVSLTYGLTEACSQVTTAPVAGLHDEALSAGSPLFCTQVRITNGGQASREELRNAKEGEITIAGPTVAPRSLDGVIDEDGRLHVTGRKADTIVSGGENVAPAEVEAVLEEHPEVLEAAVLGRADERWGEAVTAIVVTRPDTLLDAEALRAHCARGLAAHKVPKQVLFAHEPLPRTRSGKLLRKELLISYGGAMR